MLSKRIIPCLDIKDGRVVKGVNFFDLKDAGDPVELAKKYTDSGADELVFLDITASHEKRGTLVDLVEKVAKNVFIPFSVGGGIRTTEEIRQILKVGADKISVNSSAVRNPDLINEGAQLFGNQCIILAIDAKQVGDRKWEVYLDGARTPTGIDVIEWAFEGVKRGAGEILLTSIGTEGTQTGFDLTLTKTISRAVSVPVIASGGAGKLDDFADVFTKGAADAALAASLFHYEQLTICDVKEYLFSKGIPMRMLKKQ